MYIVINRPEVAARLIGWSDAMRNKLQVIRIVLLEDVLSISLTTMIGMSTRS
jgi:hypothetical protein